VHLSSEQGRRTLKWPVSRSAKIAAPASKVWETISAPESLLESHPYLVANPVDVWDRANSRDEVHYLNGVVYERHFREWHEGIGFDLEIFARDKPMAWVSWRISADGADSSRLTITVYPYGLQRWPALIRWLPQWLIVRPRLKGYLISVLLGFDWFISKGTRVPRNEFGMHPWFSKF